MDVSNLTGQNTGYRVVGAGGVSSFDTPEAMQEDLSAESDIREGRYETFPSVEEFARQLPSRLREVREKSTEPLAPGEVETVLPPPCSFRVTFLIAGQEVASATFFKDPGVITLVEDEWGFRVQPGNGSIGEIPL